MEEGEENSNPEPVKYHLHFWEIWHGLITGKGKKKKNSLPKSMFRDRTSI